jgi:chloramphenicol-sensitive protein RarD
MRSPAAAAARTDNEPMPAGPLAAALAYALWGIFPLYIKQIAAVPPLEIVLHRSWWSMVFVFTLLAAARRLAWLRGLGQRRRLLALTALSALLLSANWLLYVWAVNANRVLDASLGYFITPLLNVLLGTLVLHERPRPLQWLAVALAGAGVLWLTLAAGSLPWIALVLAASFGVYGLLRKTAPLGAVEGLALETLLLAPLAGGGLAWLLWQGRSSFGAGDWSTDAWLLAGGPFTAVPLLLFAFAARRVTLATLGLLQYLGPSITFLLGIFVYHEPFAPARGVGFALIWAALVVYSAEGLWRLRRMPVAA